MPLAENTSLRPMSQQLPGPPSGNPHTVWRNARWGIVGGLVVAAIYSVWIIILMFVQGSVTLTVRGQEQVNGVVVIASYLVGGVGGGAVVGILRPLLARKAGAAIVGVIAAIPMILAVRVVLRGFQPWDSEDAVVLGISCVILGVFGGLILWGVLHEPNAPRTED